MRQELDKALGDVRAALQRTAGVEEAEAGQQPQHVGGLGGGEAVAERTLLGPPVGKTGTKDAYVIADPTRS
ncbi:hypothetical protein OHB54_03285 [Streptomyces sp. NBC_01007]|nr:hypothetical protein OHB54_03285 [Streptomyces sp. NBC_01007]